MSGHIIYDCERTSTTTVSNSRGIDGQSDYGAAIVEIVWQPGADIAAAEAQVPAGLKPDDRIVADPWLALLEGEKVDGMRPEPGAAARK